MLRGKIGACTKEFISRTNRLIRMLNLIQLSLRSLLFSFLFFLSTCYILKDDLSWQESSQLHAFSLFYVEMLLSALLFDFLESFKISIATVDYSSLQDGLLIFVSKAFVVSYVIDIILKARNTESEFQEYYEAIRNDRTKFLKQISKEFTSLLKNNPKTPKRIVRSCEKELSRLLSEHQRV